MPIESVKLPVEAHAFLKNATRAETACGAGTMVWRHWGSRTSNPNLAPVALLHGELTSEHYEDAAAIDPRIDILRSKMVVAEEPRYSKDYLDPDLRSISNRIQVHFVDGSASPAIEVEFPLGHRRRRSESLGPLETKFRHNAGTRFSAARVDSLVKMFEAVPELMSRSITCECSSIAASAAV